MKNKNYKRINNNYNSKINNNYNNSQNNLLSQCRIKKPNN